MNSNVGKIIIYFLVIGFIIAFLIYFYNSLATDDVGKDFIEIKTRSTKTNIREDINLELLQEQKFINLQSNSSERAVFKAGKRNPFEPYD